MTADERRRRFLLNWYAVYGAAGQISVTQNLMKRITTGYRTNNGITYTYQPNGWVLVNGNNTSSSTSFSGYVGFWLEPGTYKTSPYVNDIGLYVQYKRTSSTWATLSPTTNNVPFIVTPEISQYEIVARLSVVRGHQVDNVMYEPYIVRVE